MACPYEGVRTMIEDDPEYYLEVVVGEADAPQHQRGVVEKCTFCANLIDRGEVPACMQLCPDALAIGVISMIRSPRSARLSRGENTRSFAKIWAPSRIRIT